MRPVVFDILTNGCNFVKIIVTIMTQYFITLLEVSFHQNGES
ncbi:hypothetical protein OTSGILL_1187 [Orientia tsutsugamushi str. Gilliam]|uniref:Uncharacterized protein n=2 Tax=Orientia tsutsugamushi TaxID=784 RepID=A0A0F3MB24_ORITS|nr:hypothetical protein [Orientia tsutsugamushi]KJV50726.1 hypothetical protein OTSGILL_2802 [Orientia tsutsugamushi str. Gilliam]KJV52841.1 hypothetical protein OTSGILL_1187 [Orientia tsutsugamushi str. Gilliam]KJV72637.1 hypothetical protein OTSTA716_1867 [Orientia tsutsugamushi str. TA716]